MTHAASFFSSIKLCHKFKHMQLMQGESVLYNLPQISAIRWAVSWQGDILNVGRNKWPGTCIDIRAQVS